MFPHLVHLLVRSFKAIPGTLSSNWLALGFPVVGVIYRVVSSAFKNGWKAAALSWAKDARAAAAGIGIGYLLLYAWCVVSTTYQDHQELSNGVKALRSTIEQSVAHQKEVVSGLEGQCAHAEADRERLNKQVTDQQTIINGCNTRLPTQPVVEPQKTTVLPEPPSGDPLVARYLLLTNKDVTPVHIHVVCDQEIAKAVVDPVRMNVAVFNFSNRWRGKTADLEFESPAWTPTAPLKVAIAYKAHGFINCDFTP